MFSGNDNSNSNQNLYQQNQLSNPLISNQHFDNERVPRENQNNGYDNLQNSAQQVQYYSPHIQQQYNQDHQPQINNPIIVVAVNQNPNLANPQPISPELIYCKVTVRKSKNDQSSLELKDIIKALREVWAEQNLNFPQFNITGKMNLLSEQSFQTKIVDPIIQSNTQIPVQSIEAGKVSLCIRTLQQSIKKYGKFSLIMALSCVLISLIGQVIYSLTTNTLSGIFAGSLIQVFTWGMLLSTQLFSLLMCNSRCISLNYWFSFSCWFQGVILLVMSGVFDSNEEIDFNLTFVIFLAVQIPLFFLGFGVMMTIHDTVFSLNRLLVLIKKQNESSLEKKGY